MAKDKKLFSKIRQNDHKSFIEAYDLYVDHIYRFIYFKVSDREEAHDLTSTVFLKTWQFIQNQAKEAKKFKTLKPLIYRIARTSVIDYYRKRSPDISIEAFPDPKQDILDEDQDISIKIDNKLSFALIEKKLHYLKDEYKEIIIWRFLDQLSVKEIAQILDKKRANIRVLIHRALQSLKELME